MSDTFDFNSFLRPMDIKELEELQWNLLSFRQRSWTGRLFNGRSINNTFIEEAYVSLQHSIELFKQGFFDCAFYCLRSSIDLSTTIVYFLDVDGDEKEKNYKNWNEKGYFPSRSELMGDISNKGKLSCDITQKMSSLFEKRTGFIDSTIHRLDKHVHKQGFDEFYVIRNNPSHCLKYPETELIREFIDLFKGTLEIVAAMRLIVDPFPVLLLDPEIDLRCPDFDESYECELVKKYFIHNEIDEYKKTKVYEEAYEYFIEREKCYESVIDIRRYSIYDRSKESEIREKFHFLDSSQVIMANMIFSCPKIIRITDHHGFPIAFTENVIHDLSNAGFSNLSRDGQYNVPYNGRLISSFVIKNNDENNRYFIDHFEPFNDEEIETISQYLKKYEGAIQSLYVNEES